MPLIRDIRVILTAPAGINLVVVKVETSEPGLYGLGCATFTQRYLAVQTAVESHLRPLLIGRDTDRIEDLWQLMSNNAYWRNGPVLNNAIAGVDLALWDILGKRSGLPVYQLLGGKCREAAAIYQHADGRDPIELEDAVSKLVESGLRHVRVQCSGYGASRDGSAAENSRRPDNPQPGRYYDPRAYVRKTLAVIEHVRGRFGLELELIHDVHERLEPAMAVEFAKAVERFGLFFLEDPLSPEHLPWLHNIRQTCTTPIAMGELFCHPLEWTPTITGRLIDFMRMHITQMGGLTPARKVALLGELHGVRTAWHGPGDVSPVGHAANLHLSLASSNFGIQELVSFTDAVREVFPGCPELRNGYVYANERSGFGIDIDESAAAKYPCSNTVVEWTQARLPDGTLHRP